MERARYLVGWLDRHYQTRTTGGELTASEVVDVATLRTLVAIVDELHAIKAELFEVVAALNGDSKS